MASGFVAAAGFGDAAAGGAAVPAEPLSLLVVDSAIGGSEIGFASLVCPGSAVLAGPLSSGIGTEAWAVGTVSEAAGAGDLAVTGAALDA